MAANLDSMFFAFIIFVFGTSARWTEHQVQYHARSNSNYTTLFRSLTEEQLTLITDCGSHGTSFRLMVDVWRKASVTLRPRLTPILFSRQAQPAYICLPSENWLPDLDSHQDKRFNKPPCYFDTTWQWYCRQDSHLHRSV